VVGALRGPPFRQMLAGAFAGSVTGAAGGALLVTPYTLLPIAVGSVLLIGFAAVVRYFSR